MHYDEGEDLENIVNRLIASLDGVTVKPVKSVRLKEGERKKTLVKITFEALQDKIAVLRAKFSLRSTNDFSKVFLRSSKSHVERLIDINFKKLLDIIPGGESLRVAASRRIVERTSSRDDDQDTGSFEDPSYGIGSVQMPIRGRRSANRRGWGYRGARGGVFHRDGSVKRRRIATASNENVPYSSTSQDDEISNQRESINGEQR